MPRGDRTGPMGMGPMTGRGAGYCAGNDSPGFMNNAYGRPGRPAGYPAMYGSGRPSWPAPAGYPAAYGYRGMPSFGRGFPAGRFGPGLGRGWGRGRGRGRGWFMGGW